MYKLDEHKRFCESGYDINDEPLLATLFTTGNGYMGVRGSFEEFGSLRIQGAFVRGFIDEIIEVCEPFANNDYMKKYYLDETKLKDFEKQDSCVNMPDFLTVRVGIGGKIFTPWDFKIIDWRRYLDPATGVYTREVTCDDGNGNVTRLCFTRFASFDCRHLYCQRVEVTPVNHSEEITFISGIDTKVKTCGQVITQDDALERNGTDIYYAFHATNRYKFSAAYSVRSEFPEGQISEYGENGVYGYSVICERAKTYVLEKSTFVGTSRDTDGDLHSFVLGGARGQSRSFNDQLKSHLLAYGKYFSTMDVTISGDDELDGYLRFASYHTAISADTKDSVHGVAAKGLTGERYNQFVWWDCEIHQLPFFIFTAPETAKNLLKYRYNLLDQSKKNAEKNGYKGAMYAFCSSVEGDEKVWIYARHPFMQIHINSDVPFGFFAYLDATGDKQFFNECGIPVITECLRFWADRVTERNGRYEILEVTGTDEHHPYVDNDAYTNYCVQYLFSRYVAKLDEYGTALSKEERERFKDIASRLYLPVCHGGLIPQFDGYFDLSLGLEESGGGTLKQFQMKKSGLYHKSQVIKQPDVALLYTFADVGLDRSNYSANWDYYEQTCETSSSLTFPVHAVASAHNGRMLSFRNYFEKTLKIDVDDIHGVGWQGVHSGCLAGGYLSIIKGIFGVRVLPNHLEVSPNPYPFWKELSARMYYRGSLIWLTMKEGVLTVSLLEGNPVSIDFGGGVENLSNIKIVRLY